MGVAAAGRAMVGLRCGGRSAVQLRAVRLREGRGTAGAADVRGCTARSGTATNTRQTSADNTAAASPKPSQPAVAPQPPAALTNNPVATIPTPGPGIDHTAPPMRVQLGKPPQPPLRGEHERPRADRAGDETHDRPDPELAGQAHREGQKHGERQPRAHHPRRFDAQRGACHRSGEIAGVVERSQPAAMADVESAAMQHQRQQRRKGEAPDPQHHGQRYHASDGRLARRVGTGGSDEVARCGERVHAASKLAKMGQNGGNRGKAVAAGAISFLNHLSLTFQSRKMNNKIEMITQRESWISPP